jgi:adenylate cyclase
LRLALMRLNEGQVMAAKQPSLDETGRSNDDRPKSGPGAAAAAKPGAGREMRYALVTEAMTEGVYDWNVATGALWVSARLNEIMGFEPEALTAADWNARIHEDDFDGYREALRRYFKGETPAHICEYRVRRQSGDLIWVSDRGRCVRDDAGRAVRLVGAINDITAHRLAEASLRRSEERYALAMQAVDEGVYDWNLETGEIYYSESVHNAVGLTPAQMSTADDWFGRIHPDDQPRWRAALVDHFKRRAERFLCEFRYRDTDDEWRWARQHGIARFDDTGRATRVIGATGDITELKRQQSAAAEAQEQLAQAIDAISEGFSLYDAEDRLVLCNEQYRQIYAGLEDVLKPGLKHEEILRAFAGRGFIPEADIDSEKWVRQRLHRHLNPGAPYEQQLADGRWVKVAWRKMASGGIAGIFTDITELKEIEFALRESERRYAQAMESANEALWDWDIATGTIYMAPHFARRFGLEIDEHGHMTTEHWASRIHPEDLDIFQDAIRAHLRGETDFYTAEFRALDADDNYIWIFHRGLGQRGEDGRVHRMMGSTADITDRKAAERAIEAARDEAEAAQQRLIDAIESISEGLVLFDADDRIVIGNSNYRQYFMDAVGEEVARLVVPGASFWDIIRAAHAAGMFPDLIGIDFEAYIAKRKERRRSGEARQAVEQHMCDGRWLQINEHKTASGGIAAVYTDVTDMKRREAELAEKTATLEGLSAKLARYLPPQVYGSIFSGARAVEVAAQRKKLTIFFSDIADFTATADMLESEELTTLLNQYLTEMSAIALEYGATIDKFIGDAVLAFFGDPETKGVKEDALACVRMAIAMQRRIRELREEWRGRGLDQGFEMRVGIATGFCTVGNFGSEDRLDYTVIGNPVNLAARLQSRAELGGILIGAETEALVRGEVKAEEQETLELKGIPRPVRTYKVVGIYDELEGEGRVIRRDQTGLKLEIDRANLSPEEREAAVRALEEAAAQLRK